MQRLNINYQKSYTEAPAHASYYPKAFPLIIKLLFCVTTGLLLGAQVIGINGVDKWVDIIATLIQFEKTVFDMVELNLAYAPPYSSSKDPINIAGMVAKNMIVDGYKVIFWNELNSYVNDGALIIDVRTQQEYELNNISDSINIPLESIRKLFHRIPKERNTILVCQQGKKSYFAYRILKQHQYTNISRLSGGLKIYRFAVTESFKTVKNAKKLNVSKNIVCNIKNK